MYIKRYNICTIDLNKRKFSKFIYKKIETERNEFPFYSLYHIHTRDVKSALTQYRNKLNDSIGDVKSCGLKGEGRRD